MVLEKGYIADSLKNESSLPINGPPPHEDDRSSPSETEYDGGFNTLPERGKWPGKLDFIFGCISYAVGLGNVWRFPYLTYQNGGGAFLIPYIIAIIFCGIPLFVLEVSVGQYLSTGGVGMWNLVPILKGVGFASMFMIFLSNIYYIILIAYTLFYLVASFQYPLPWEKCGNSWNTENCVAPRYNMSESLTNHSKSDSPVQEYWENNVLQITDGIHDLGHLRPELVLYLTVAWILVYFVIWRGLHQSGKIIWFTALFPYLILLVLFGRGVTLTGASEGLKFYLTPDWEKLKLPTVWVQAGTQVLFSYGVGIGTNVALGSYNRYHDNFYRDSMIVCLISSGTSIFSGFVIFSILGHMSFLQDKPVSEVAQSGPGLAFLAYPEVVVKLPFAPIWSIMFFLMLTILGTDSQFCTVESLVTGLVDEFAVSLRPHRRKFTLLIVALQFVLGLPLVTQGGMYLFQLMDFHAASGAALLTVVFFETVGLAWIYGYKKIYNNFQHMLGFAPSYYFVFCWVIGAPAIIMGIFIFSLVEYEPVTYADKYTYPWWGEFIGWCISLSSMLWIPSYAIYYLYKAPGTLKERIKLGLSPAYHPPKPERTPSTEEETSLDMPILLKPVLAKV